jgi:polar amino acid transport system substrate-binding protein
MNAVRIHRRLVGAALGATLLVLFGCQKPAEAPAPKAEAPKADAASAAPPAPKVLMVGTDAAYAPFESQNEKGEIVGFDIDLMRAVAQKAGLEVKFVNTPWEGIFNALAQGDRDLLVSTITITAERKQTIDFSDPYFDAHQLIAVKEKSTVAKFADLKPLKVGVQTGTTGDDVVSKLLGKTSTQVRRFESAPLAIKELEAGGLDAVVIDNGVLVNFVANNPASKVRLVNDPAFEPEQYGIAVRKGNADLLAKVNKGLADVRADGTYDRLYQTYFGKTSLDAAKK